MRSSGDERPDFFDPFWMFFADDYSDEEGYSASRNRNKWMSSSNSRSNKNREEETGLLDYFMGDDERNRTSQQRNKQRPKLTTSNSSSNISNSKNHYWRRPNSKQRRNSFNRFSKSEPEYGRSLFVPEEREATSTTSFTRRVSTSSFKREKPISNNNNTKKKSSLAPTAFPNFMEAFAGQWDPFGDGTSEESSRSSVVDSYDEESSQNEDESSEGETSLVSQKHQEARKPKQQIEQIVVQFNPKRSSSSILDKGETVTMDQDNKRSINKSSSSTNPNTISSYEEDQAAYYGDNNEFGDTNVPANPEVVPATTMNGTVVEGFEVEEGPRSPSSYLNFQQLVCCSAKNREQTKALLFNQCSKPVRDMSEEELAQMFPKLRLVADEKPGGNAKYSPILAQGKEFRGELPPHLQLSSDVFKSTKGPQSVYEYEYEHGQHMDVCYNHYGIKAQSLIMVRRLKKPPSLDCSHEGVIVKVEVRHSSF